MNCAEWSFQRPNWTFIDWWYFVFDDSRCRDKTHGDDEVFNGRWWWKLADYWSGPIRSVSYLFRCYCRASNHSYGVGWYNLTGLEPDMHCRGCGEDLG